MGQLNTHAPAAVAAAAATESSSSMNCLRVSGGSSGCSLLSGPVAVSVRSSLTDKLIHVTAVVTTATTNTTNLPPPLKTETGIGTASGSSATTETKTSPMASDKRSAILPSTTGSSAGGSSSVSGMPITDEFDNETEAAALLAALAKLIPPTPTITTTASLHSPPTVGGSSTAPSSSSFSPNSGSGMGMGMGMGIGTPSIFKNKYNSLTNPSGSILPLPSSLSPANGSTTTTRTPPSSLSNTFLGLQSVKPLSSPLPSRCTGSGTPGAYAKGGLDPYTPLVHAVSFGPDSRVSMPSRKNLVLEKAHSQVCIAY